jgi:L-asparagine permease
VDGHTPGPSTDSDTGVFPVGAHPVLLVIQGVIFAYASVELCGVAAGETENPEKIMSRAINSLMWRVGLFHVGSVVLLALLLPCTAHSGDQSPFVTVMDKLGVPGAAGVMNKGQVPYGGVLLTAGFGVLGVGLNYVVPGQAFEIVLNYAPIGILGTWGMIMLCSPAFWHRSQNGRVTRPAYRLPWVPYTQIVTLLFLVGVAFLMWWGGGAGRTTVMCLPLTAALVGGWFLVRGRMREMARVE